MRLDYPKYEFIVSSHSKTRTSILVDRPRMISVLELCLKFIRVRDTLGRDCLNPSILCFINDLKKAKYDFVLFQTTQKAIFEVWFFLALVYHSTELGDSDEVSWAYNSFNHYMLAFGTKHRVISKEIL